MIGSDLVWETYDDFSGPRLDERRWRFREADAPDGTRWRYADPGATTRRAECRLEIDVPRFERAHDTVPAFDNAKVLLLTTRTFGFDDADVLAPSARVAAEMKGAVLRISGTAR